MRQYLHDELTCEFVKYISNNFLNSIWNHVLNMAVAVLFRKFHSPPPYATCSLPLAMLATKPQSS